MLGELELAWRLLPNRFVAVTGTNGKTTVDRAARPRLAHRRPSRSRSPATSAPRSRRWSVRSATEATVVCEASSFQLEDAEAFAPECAVLLNVTPDHLDRHRDFEDYLRGEAADLRQPGERRRRRLQRRRARARRQGPGRLRPADRLLPRSRPRLRRLDRRGRSLRGIRAADGGRRTVAARPAQRRERDGGRRRRDWRWGSIASPIREALRTFPGVPHRLERVAEIDGVLYVNDSKATNVAAAVAALRSFDGGVRAILGGSLKGGGFEGLAEPVAERCVACYLIGEAAERWRARPGRASRRGAAPLRGPRRGGGPRRPPRDASRARWSCSRPACASFDAYRDFEERGEHFRALVEGLGDERVLARPARAPRRRTKSGAQPIEYSLLLTATLCLLAFGVVMVFSASSTTALLGQSGDSAYYLKRTLAVGAIGLVRDAR